MEERERILDGRSKVQRQWGRERRRVREGDRERSWGSERQTKRLKWFPDRVSRAGEWRSVKVTVGSWNLERGTCSWDLLFLSFQGMSASQGNLLFSGQKKCLCVSGTFYFILFILGLARRVPFRYEISSSRASWSRGQYKMFHLKQFHMKHNHCKRREP